MNSEDLFV